MEGVQNRGPISAGEGGVRRGGVSRAENFRDLVLATNFVEFCVTEFDIYCRNN